MRKKISDDSKMQKCIYGKRVTFFDHFAQKCENGCKIGLKFNDDSKMQKCIYGKKITKICEFYMEWHTMPKKETKNEFKTI